MGTRHAYAGVDEERGLGPLCTAVSEISDVSGVASVTIDAGSAGVRHVVDGFGFGVAHGASTITATTVGVYVIDGASGGSDYLFAEIIPVPATGISPINAQNVRWVGSPSTALTIEFSGAITNGIETVNLSYFDVK